MADTKTSVAIQASVQGLASIQGLNKGLSGLATQAKTTGGGLSRLRGAAGGAVTALRGMLPVIGVAGVAAFAKSNLDAADAMSKLSLRTGIAAPELDKFRKVAELSDTSIESLGRAFPVLSKNVKDATEKGTGPAARAFEQLGIQLANTDGSLRSTDDIMLQVSDAFAGMTDGTEKAALASQIFGGRLGSELIPLLNSGGDAVRNMSTSMTQEFADSAAVFNDRLENMQEKLGDLGVRMTTALLPALDALVAGVESLIQGFSQLPAPLQTLIAGLAGISAVALVFSPIISAVTALGPLIGSLIGLLTGGGGLAAAIAAVFTGPVGWIALLVAAGVAIYAFRDQIGAALKAIGQFFVDGFNAIGNVLKAAAEAYMNLYVTPVLRFAKNALDGIVGIFSRLVDWLGEAFTAAAQAYLDVFVTPVLRFAQGLWDKVVGLTQGAWYRLIELFDTLRQTFLDTFVTPVVKLAQNAWDGIVSVFNRLPEAIKTPFIAVGNVIRSAWDGIVSVFNRLLEAIKTPFIAVVKLAQSAWDGIVNVFNRLPQAIKAPFIAVGNVIRSVWNKILTFVANSLNNFISKVNAVINLANRLPNVNIPSIPLVQGPQEVPSFAGGGYTGNGPRSGGVDGKGGFPAILHPRERVIDLAAGGAMAGGGGSVAMRPAQINITTGPVMQADGQNWVSMQDLQRAMRATEAATIARLRTYAGRRAVGAV